MINSRTTITKKLRISNIEEKLGISILNK